MLAAVRLVLLETGFVGKHRTAAIHHIGVNGRQLSVLR